MKPFELEKEIQSKIRFGLDKESIERSLKESVPDAAFLKEAVERVCDDYPDYDLIQFFVKSKVLVDKDGEEDQLYMYNAAKGKVRTINKTQLNSVISSKLNWSSRRYTCNFVYDPLKPYILSKVDGEWNYNVYKPPFWERDYFYSCGKIPIPKNSKIPKIYEKFFLHLVNNDSKSYTYLVKWLANMVQRRNQCILTTIGSQGIGKGVLGSIMMSVLGRENFVLTAKRAISKGFNGQIKNKRLVYLDEIKVTTQDQENTLKGMINSYQEIEGKGKDAEMVENHSSIYFSSNNLDSIKIPADDRRFSVLELTDKKLLTIMTIEEIESLLCEKNIEKLAHFLKHFEVDATEMGKVFRSSRVELIKSAGLNRWQEWFLEEYAPEMAGKTLLVKEVSKDIEEGCDINSGPGRSKLISFSDIYSDVFEVKNVRLTKGQRQKWCIIFKEQKK